MHWGILTGVATLTAHTSPQQDARYAKGPTSRQSPSEHTTVSQACYRRHETRCLS